MPFCQDSCVDFAVVVLGVEKVKSVKGAMVLVRDADLPTVRHSEAGFGFVAEETFFDDLGRREHIKLVEVLSLINL